MCGIVGAVTLSKGSKMLDREYITEGLIETSSRGTDATGFWSPATGVIKDGIDAKDFTRKYKREIAAVEDAKVWIGHCRSATRGKHTEAPPSNNENNHPFETERWVLVHNGVLSDSPELKEYKYKGACDSEVAISYLEKFGEQGFKYILSVDSASLVAYDKQENLLYFWRNKNPLVWAISEDHSILAFGSTVDIIDSMMEEQKIAGFQVYKRLVAYSSAEHEMVVIQPGKGLVRQEKVEPMLLYRLRQMDIAKEFDIPKDRWEDSRSSYDGAPYGWDRKAVITNISGNQLRKYNPYAVGGGTYSPVVCFPAVVDHKVVWSGRMIPGTCIGRVSSVGEFMALDKLFEYPSEQIFPS
jgi:hypothetical protein